MTALDPMHFDEVRGLGFSPAGFRPDAGETGAIQYHLAQPGIVRVFIRPKKRRFLAVRTLADWEPQQAGDHTLVWDGKDSKGNILSPALYCAVVQSQPLRGTVHREHLSMDDHYHHADMIA